jgi:hypothetical protein
MEKAIRGEFLASTHETVVCLLVADSETAVEQLV